MKKGLLNTLFLFILMGCNFARALESLPVDSVSTQVSAQLTSSPFPGQIYTSTPTIIPFTETPSPTETETAIPTVTLTATLSPDDPRARLGNPTWKETFDKPNQNFYQDDNESIRFIYESGDLVLTAKNPNWTSWSMSYHKPANYYLEATFKVGECSSSDRYGLVFRAPDLTDGYFFGITCDGRFALKVFSQKGELIAWTNHPAINTGSNQVNRVGVLVQNNRYALYTNGKLLQETIDDTFVKEGLFGAYIASSTTTNFTVRVEDIAFWNQ
ncbi:MAG: hypothetical protein GX577_09510 [Leptolinea sp.]|nr:hypothetical protein [Leptolinea sp.]